MHAAGSSIETPKPSMPRVSVVMPIHNAATFLRQTLRTLQEQRFGDWELIAIDDGSRDDSAAIVAEIAREDPRIRLLQQPNAGVSIARNRGVAASQAPLIAFLDADDLWHPDKLQQHVARHERDPGLGVSFARVEFLTPAGIPTGQVASQPRSLLRPATFLYENPTTTTSNWVLRREVFEALGGFIPEMSYSEDLEWLLRVACQGRWRIELINRVLTYYRTSDGGLSASLERMESGWLRLVVEARRYAPSLVDQHFARAQATHLRYLARRSLRLRIPPEMGSAFMARALRSDPWLLLREPRRTGLTALAVFGRSILEPLRRRQTDSHAAPPALAAEPLAVHSAVFSTEPLVSVVMPLYNSASTVAASLDSVLAQTYLNIEILVVDDGSTDDGVRLCRQYGDARIRIVQQKNRGLAGARNTGIRNATGSILAFLDSDDLWLPEKVERHVQHLRANPVVGVSYSRSAFIDAAGRPLGIYQTPPLHGITPELILCRNPISNGSCVVMRREVLDGIRFEANLYGSPESYWFDDSFRQSEDIECWLRIALLTQWRIEGIPEALTLYRVSSGGLSANIEKQFASWQRVLDKTEHYAPELIRRHGERALGYQLRYLARRSIREGQPRLGVKLAHQALNHYPRLWREEPIRTLITLAAAHLGVLLPQGLYKLLEGLMMKITGLMQRLKMGRQARALAPHSGSLAESGGK
ncbi:glycosyltransferase [Synechococcus sp. 1G10]|uniref:glycosyltransferase family 2 protein n=1 Tax=Synechococcus sp. 1G10 TaxID=2025605 RepID=UPI001E498D97|nr:glycosyltransferase [Synechococcus sp. 1G10]